MQQTIEKIANTVLDIDTLKRQNLDSKDFHALAVWRIEEALQAAYMAGKNSNDKKATNSVESGFYIKKDDRAKTGFVTGGFADKYTFQAKVFNEASDYGVESSRVSKLFVVDAESGVEVYVYDRGLDTHNLDKKVLDAILDNLKNLPAA